MLWCNKFWLARPSLKLSFLLLLLLLFLLLFYPSLWILFYLCMSRSYSTFICQSVIFSVIYTVIKYLSISKLILNVLSFCVYNFICNTCISFFCYNCKCWMFIYYLIDVSFEIFFCCIGCGYERFYFIKVDCCKKNRPLHLYYNG